MKEFTKFTETTAKRYVEYRLITVISQPVSTERLNGRPICTSANISARTESLSFTNTRLNANVRNIVNAVTAAKIMPIRKAHFKMLDTNSPTEASTSFI